MEYHSQAQTYFYRKDIVGMSWLITPIYWIYGTCNYSQWNVNAMLMDGEHVIGYDSPMIYL